MQAKVRTVAFQGIDVLPVDVQVLVAPGQLAFAMVGLADKAVGESRERVRATFRALGLSLPPQRITVNLSPADLAKEGSHYDLPIALGLLAAMGVVPREAIAGYVVLGELAWRDQHLHIDRQHVDALESHAAHLCLHAVLRSVWKEQS